MIKVILFIASFLLVVVVYSCCVVAGRADRLIENDLAKRKAASISKK